MTHISHLFDVDEFYSLIDRGYISFKPHGELPISIANYTPKTQYERLWTPETINSRGLIVDNKAGTVVARGFPKFFNYSEVQETPESDYFIQTPKMDGSLLIAFSYGGATRVATRGSFHSEQAIKATSMLKRYPNLVIPRGTTPLFEVIYPENRIVCDYGKDEKLVLLDIIDNRTGRSLPGLFNELDWPDKVTKTFIIGFSEEIQNEIPSGEEGYVLYWPKEGVRLKIKSQEYITLHRAITGISDKRIWEALVVQGLTEEEYIAPLPDEFHNPVKDKIEDFEAQVQIIIEEAYDQFASINPSLVDNRADFAHAVMAEHKEFAKYLFRILDGKEIDSLAWEAIKPSGNTLWFSG